MIDPNLDHVGIVVPQLEPAVEALSKYIGVEWIGTVEPMFPMHDAARGTREVKLRIANSTLYPRLELIEALPDSPWALDEGAGMVLHHLAFFVDDLSEDSSSVAGPCPVEICGAGPDGEVPTVFTYHVHNGFRFELLDPFLRQGSIERFR
jgi:hypothetical protein